MDPYRAPADRPGPPGSRGWRDRLRIVARVLLAIALPLGAGWLVTIPQRRGLCPPRSYLNVLWGAPGVVLACSLGVAWLLLTGTRFFSRE